MQQIAKFRCRCGTEEWVVYQEDEMLEKIRGYSETKCSDCGGEFTLYTGSKIDAGLIVVWREYELGDSGAVESSMERVLKRGEQFPQPTQFIYCHGCEATHFIPRGAEVMVCCGFRMEGPIGIGEGAISTWQEEELGV